MDTVVWLRSLGLGKYEAIFRENDIDGAVLSSLRHENLKELGVASFGHRVKLLDAIAALRGDASAKTPAAHPTPAATTGRWSAQRLAAARFALRARARNDKKQINAAGDMLKLHSRVTSAAMSCVSRLTVLSLNFAPAFP